MRISARTFSLAGTAAAALAVTALAATPAVAATTLTSGRRGGRRTGRAGRRERGVHRGPPTPNRPVTACGGARPQRPGPAWVGACAGIASHLPPWLPRNYPRNDNRT